jgi:hypothetical protein
MSRLPWHAADGAEAIVHTAAEAAGWPASPRNHGYPRISFSPSAYEVKK